MNEAERSVEEIERLKKALEREEHYLVRRIIEDKIEELKHGVVYTIRKHKEKWVKEFLKGV